MTRQTTQIDSLGSDISQHIHKYNQKVQAGEDAAEEISLISSACRKLDAHITPPTSWAFQVATAYNSSVSMCLLLDLNIFQLLSESKEATSLDTLAERSRSSKSLLRCALRECVARYILDEPSPETYKLNSCSTCLLDEDGVSWMHYLCDDGLFTGAHLSRYLAENGGQIPSHRHKTAFQMAFQTNQPFYSFLRSTDPRRGERFDKGMQWKSRGSAIMTPIEKIFSFSQLKPDAVVVDVGGGRGHHAIRIASQNPRFSFIIQDHGADSPEEEDKIDPKVLQRLQWQHHDFYTEQPVKGADLYLLSCILMDHSPEDCCKILGHIADAMTPNESILLLDDNIDLGKEQSYSPANDMNLHLLACFGTLTRTMEEWETLFSQVPGGLSIVDSWVAGSGRGTFALKKLA